MATRPPAASELTTPRLRLRRWRASDELPMAEINADPEVTRYLNRPVDPAASRMFLVDAEAHWDRHRCGIYAVETLGGPRRGVLLGFVGLAFPGYLPAFAHRLELGWRLRREDWGRGYATEAASAVRDHAVEALGVHDLVSIIHPENERSRRVAAKLGMTVETEVLNPRIDRLVEVWSLPGGSSSPGAR